MYLHTVLEYHTSQPQQIMMDIAVKSSSYVFEINMFEGGTLETILSPIPTTTATKQIKTCYIVFLFSQGTQI